MDNKWEHKEKYRVRGYEVDASNHATVQVFCNYMEEVAGLHATALGLSMERLQDEGITWVLARMQISVKDFPLSGGEVELVTWPVSVERLQFRRDFEIYGVNKKLYAQAITQWVIVNLESRKVERVPAFISGVRPENPKNTMPESSWRIAGQAESPELARFNVRQADIDRNRHVNNVRFIDWIFESAPFSHDPAMRLENLEVIFRAEAVYGDKIISRGTTGEVAGEFLHGIFRESDGRELVRARTKWESRT